MNLFKTTIIKIDEFTSKKGTPCKLAWFTCENGLPAKAFLDSKSPLKAGDSATVTIEPDFNCSGRIVIK